QGPPVGAREDQIGRHAGDTRSLQHPPEFVAAFCGKGTLGVRLAGAGIVCDSVSQQVDLHQAFTLLAGTRRVRTRPSCRRAICFCRLRKMVEMGWPASMTVKLYGSTIESSALMRRAW